MKLGSLFDGSGTCPLAASSVGITPTWASEIEPFPRAVTASHFPSMVHVGDITKLRGDAPEYKMWGNGMAFPCMLYIMEGVQEVLQERYLQALFGKEGEDHGKP